MRATDRQVTTKLLQYRSPGQVVEEYNAIRFVNKGTINATINNVLTLEPGESIGWGYNANEIDKSYIDIGFPTGGRDGLVVAIIVCYKD
jgi:hypothetical protein